MEKELLRPALTAYLLIVILTLIQFVRYRDSLILEERLKLAVESTHRFASGFLFLSIAIAIISLQISWVTYVLWVIAIVGVFFHTLMLFGKPEKWSNYAQLFGLICVMTAVLLALFGTFL